MIMIILNWIWIALCMLWTGYCAYKKDIYSEIVCAMCSIITTMMLAINLYLSIH